MAGVIHLWRESGGGGSGLSPSDWWKAMGSDGVLLLGESRWRAGELARGRGD